MNEDFNPQQLVDLAKDLVKDQIEGMSHSDMIACIRDVVVVMTRGGLLKADPTSPTESIEAAMQLLYICQLIPEIFPIAYNLAEVELDLQKDKDSVVESLKRSLEL